MYIMYTAHCTVIGENLGSLFWNVFCNSRGGQTLIIVYVIPIGKTYTKKVFFRFDHLGYINGFSIYVHKVINMKYG